MRKIEAGTVRAGSAALYKYRNLLASKGIGALGEALAAHVASVAGITPTERHTERLICTACREVASWLARQGQERMLSDEVIDALAISVVLHQLKSQPK